MKQLTINFAMERFEKYHEKNPQIYEKFKAIAFEAIRRGHKNLSAEFIFNVIRWKTNVSAIDDKYKICNDFKPFYARKFMKDHPTMKGFFRCRASKADSL
jgi:hypothetical protein